MKDIFLEIFKGIDEPYQFISKETDLKPFVKKSFERLTENTLQINYCQQLYNLSNTFQSMIVLGDPLSGKTVIINLLKKALSLKHDEEIPISHIFLKSSVRLFSSYNKNREWKSGIISSVLFEYAKKCKVKNQFLVVDGTLSNFDNLHYLLEGNITLPNGDILRIPSSVKIFFETDNVRNCSPNFISRNGLLFLNVPVNPDNLIAERLNRIYNHQKDLINEELFKHISSYISNAVIKILKYRKNLNSDSVISFTNNQALTFCNIFEALFNRKYGVSPAHTKEQKKKTADKMIIFALCWAVCGSLDTKLINKIETYMSTEINTNDLPKGSFLGSYIKLEEKLGFGEFESFDTLCKEVHKYDSSIPFHNIHVKSKISIRYSFIISLVSQYQGSVFLFAPQGTCKTRVIRDVMNELKNTDKFEHFTKSFLRTTKTIEVYDLIQGSLEKRNKNLFAGPGGANVVMILDDVNLPMPDANGIQKTTEFLREVISTKTYHDREKFYKKRIENVNFICSASINSTPRPDLNPRAFQNARLFYISSSMTELLSSIFEPLIMGYLEVGVTTDIKVLANSIIMTINNLVENLQLEVLPTPTNPHYLMNLKVISEIFCGLMSYDKTKVGSDKEFSRIFVHEIFRSYLDKMTTETHRNIAKGTISRIIQNNIKIDLQLPSKENELRFTLLTNPTIDENIFSYETHYDYISKLIKEAFKKIKENEPIIFIINDDTIAHILRIYRILTLPYINMTLISDVETKHKSLVKIASFLANIKAHYIVKESTKNSLKYEIEDILFSAASNNSINAIFISDNILLKKENINTLSLFMNRSTLFSKEKKDLIDQKEKQTNANISKSEAVKLFAGKALYNIHFIYSFISKKNFNDFYYLASPIIENSNINYVSFCNSDYISQLCQMEIQSICKNSPELKIDKLSEIALFMENSIVNLPSNIFYSRESYREWIPIFYLHYKHHYDKAKEQKQKLEKSVKTLKKITENMDEIDKMIQDIKQKIQEKSQMNENIYKKMTKDQ